MAVNGVGSTYRNNLARLASFLGDFEGSKLAVGNRLIRSKYGKTVMAVFFFHFSGCLFDARPL